MQYYESRSSLYYSLGTARIYDDIIVIVIYICASPCPLPLHTHTHKYMFLKGEIRAFEIMKLRLSSNNGDAFSIGNSLHNLRLRNSASVFAAELQAIF